MIPTRETRLLQFGQSNNARQAHARVRAQQKAEALMVLKSMLPAGEYATMVAQIQNGEREVRLDNGFVLTCFSPK